MRYADLPENPAGRFLYCHECHEQYSSTKGDYFWADPRTVIRCGHDNTPLRLVRAERRLIEVPAHGE